MTMHRRPEKCVLSRNVIYLGKERRKRDNLLIIVGASRFAERAGLERQLVEGYEWEVSNLESHIQYHEARNLGDGEA